MKKMKNRPQIAKGGKGNGRESPVDSMRVSMDKNEENEEIETSLMEIKIFISCSSIEGGK